MTRLRCAILDDCLNLTLTITDWSKVTDRVDITVFNQPFASGAAAAEALKDFEIICAMRERTPFPRTLGVLGLGKLGGKVSKLAQAFGMNVIAWSPNLTPERCKEVGVGYVSKEELFANADIITIHVVLSQRSRGLVGPEDLARMKPTAYIVNTARGPIIDEAALLKALQQGKIAGAGIDVYS